MPRSSSNVAIAFEGINGSGKSRVISELSRRLKSNPRNHVMEAKIAGLGTGPRFDRIRRILSQREDRLRQDTLTPDELTDYHRDRIFRIAYRHQVRCFLKSQPDKFTHVLLDRTPLMSIAYTAAVFPNSQYLPEVEAVALDYTRQLDLNFVFLLEISPAVVFGRIIARNAKADHRDVQAYAHYMRAPTHIIEEAMHVACSLLSDPSVTPKRFSVWDYMTFEEIERQLDSYRVAIRTASELLGFRYAILDSSGSLSSLCDAILEQADVPCR